MALALRWEDATTTDGNRSVLETSTVHFCTKHQRSSMSERDSYGVASQENATEVKAVGKSPMVRDLCFLLCKRSLSCSTLVCEVTTPSLQSHILRSARGLLLRVNAIVMNPLPFWLKILETFLFPPSLTPDVYVSRFPLLSFCDEPTGNRSVLETSTVHFCTKHQRSSMSERDSYGVASQETPPK